MQNYKEAEVGRSCVHAVQTHIHRSWRAAKETTVIPNKSHTMFLKLMEANPSTVLSVQSELFFMNIIFCRLICIATCCGFHVMWCVALSLSLITLLDNLQSCVKLYDSFSLSVVMYNLEKTPVLLSGNMTVMTEWSVLVRALDNFLTSVVVSDFLQFQSFIVQNILLVAHLVRLYFINLYRGYTSNTLCVHILMERS